MSRNQDAWQVDGVTLSSRFLLGTAGYPSPHVLRDAIAASRTQVVTVGLKRTLAAAGDNGFVAIVRAALAERGARLLLQKETLDEADLLALRQPEAVGAAE